MIADDQHLVRQGFRSMLDRLPSMEVVAEAGTAGEAVVQYARHRPDILLMDLRFPDRCGVEAIRAIREQFLIARIIVLTTYDGDEDVYQALQAGAKAYLLKDVTLEELVDCIEKVHRGQTFVPPLIAAKLAERTASPQLTDRELEVLRRIVAGRSNKEIAADLNITEGTVKSHVNRVLEKLGVHDRTQAATTALKRGLVRE
ncbi:response regulator [Singulisphaera sp. GP187]|uniref:response regulator n=1 Tax=Singulisphaera sp. GP187 TaxID=1882752 RepID=UPI000A4E1B60|nr:response regulator transcription factor [Singulisphaera sp. GP187]